VGLFVTIRVGDTFAPWPLGHPFLLDQKGRKNQGKTNCSVRFPIPRAVIFGFDFADLFFAFTLFFRSGLPPSLFLPSLVSNQQNKIAFLYQTTVLTVGLF